MTDFVEICLLQDGRLGRQQALGDDLTGAISWGSHGVPCQLARYPRTTPTTSTASLPVLARRVRADPHEVGRIEGIGPDLWELGAASTRASGREPVTAEDCGRDCGGGRLELGANTYRVLVHPTKPPPRGP